MKKPVIILLHAGYWLLFLLLLTAFFIMAAPVLNRGHTVAMTTLVGRWAALMTGFAIIPGAISFYTFYHFLFDWFLKTRKIVLLFLAGISMAVIAAFIGGLALSFILFWPRYMFAGGPAAAGAEIGVMSFGALVNGVIGLVMRGFIDWYGDIRLKEALAAKNYEMELALVKSQINPHFLFNTINNIDVLIEKDQVKASAYLNKLSDMMRFMLYETKTAEIALSKELLYIEKYIDLQKIRTSNAYYVSYTLTGNSTNKTIAPMLLIPFVENAFKHAENNKNDNTVSISVQVEHDALIFNCNNTFVESSQNNANEGGLGNELIQKRLELLYPGRHTLAVTNENYMYHVKLVVFNHAH